MKTKLLFLLFLFSSFFLRVLNAQNTIAYSESFNYPTNPILTSTAQWHTDISTTNIGAGTGHFNIVNPSTNSFVFEAQETIGWGVWISSAVDISCLSNVSVEVDISEQGSLDPEDSITLSYILDGGTTEILFGVFHDDFNGNAGTSPVRANISGSHTSIVVVIRAKTNSSSEQIRFDNVTVLGNDVCSNPDLSASCPMSIIFVMDESGSIAGSGGSNIATQVRNAARGLMTALNGTNSQVAVVEFNSTARIASIISPGYQVVDNNYLNNDFNYYITPPVNGASSVDYKYDPENCNNGAGCSTNWEAAFEQVYAINNTGPVAQLVLFFTDGEPTAYNNGGGVSSNSNNQSLQEASGAANRVTQQGSHIMVIGVPNGGVDTATFRNNIVRISGPEVYNQTNLITADYSIQSSTSLEAALTQIATLVCRADLWLTKTVSPVTACAGTEVIFTITVTNNGLMDATGVQAKDYLPSGYTYVSNNAGATYAAGTVTWNIGNLAAGQSVILQITATVNPSGNYLNAAEISASDQLDPDSDPGNYVLGAILEDDEAEVSVSVVNCDDGNPCTIDDCNNGVCTHTPVVVNCNITGNQTICSGQTSSFTADSAGPGTSYLWTGPAGFSPTNSNSITISIAGTYNLTVSTANGCTSTCSRTLAVNPKPPCNINGNTSICTGENTTLTASGGNSYLWNTGSTDAAITVSPSSTTIYSVIVSNATGCSDTCSVQVQVTTTCNDNNACTIDNCANGSCTHIPVVCNDNNACTTDACDPIQGCVFTPINCDDGSVCTIDICDSIQGCIHTPVSNCCSADSACDDHNLCTIESCNVNTGECFYTPVVCNDFDSCTLNTCDPVQGCIYTPISCDDGNACTLDNCDIVEGCKHSIITCNDGNACTTDACDPVQGCIYTPVSCDDSNLCTIDVCDPLVGCIHTPVNCDDGSLCTTDDCDPALGCTHHPVTCSDGDACTIDTCTATSGCFFIPKNCDDGNACTLDACNAGSCTHTLISYRDTVDVEICSGQSFIHPDGNARVRTGYYPYNYTTANGCDSIVVYHLIVHNKFCVISGTSDLGCTGGSTSFTANGDGPANAPEVVIATSYEWNTGATTATINNVSQPGIYTVTITNNFGCISECNVELQSISCTDSNACTLDVCEPGNNTCSHTPIVCDDGNPCTVDVCDPNTGCIYTPDNGATCDDLDLCTLNDVCFNGTCAGTPLNCDDNNVCTIDSCVGGSCQHTPANGSSCDDGDPCTLNDLCTNSLCAGTPVNCDDGIACTIDSCAGGTCLHIPSNCPVDCAVSDWSAFGPCSVTCGGGIQVRIRSIVTDSAFGGAPCPVLSDTVACNTDPCPVDCAVSDWSAFGPCSVTCGGGIQIRTRSVITDSAFGGLPCPVLADTVACNTTSCPVDCIVSDWSDFGPCSVTCGGGIQIRNRTITTDSAFGGLACPVLSDTTACNLDPCPVDCVVSDWVDGPCSDTCGGGIQIRTRSILVDSAFGGAACPVLSDTVACNTAPCPGDCVVSDWTDFGPCTVSCGGGIQIRTRTIITPPAGGAPCPVLEDTVACNTDPCPVDCIVSDWSSFGPCSVTCGGGIQIRTRTVTTDSAFGGTPCPVLADTAACNTDPCPVDCIVSDWSSFGPCSVICGGGMQIRTRTITTDSAFGGAPCPVLADTAACNTDPCPVDCIVSDWSSFGPCSVTCGGGIQIRTRIITTDSAFGGAPCPVLTDTTACNTDPCPVDCIVSDWSSFGPCSVTCGGGVQIRTRTVTTDSAFGGAPCPVLTDTAACNTDPCPIDCIVSDWTDFGPCSVTCGGGIQIRTRSVITDSAFGGVPCPVLADTTICNTQACDSCLLANCNDNFDCTTDTCVNDICQYIYIEGCCALLVEGFTLVNSTTDQDINPLNDGDTINLFYTPTVSVRANLCTEPVGSVEFIQNGNHVRNENDVPYSLAGDGNGDYSTWNITPGTYTITAVPFQFMDAGGVHGTERTITVYVINEEIGCAGNEQCADTIPCTMDTCINGVCFNIPVNCPVDCEVSDWSDFGPCSVSCGGGIQIRTRSILTDSAFGGLACPVLEDTLVCNTDTCPTPADCIVSDWIEGPCSVDCGGGLLIRTRTIINDSAFGGLPCPVLTDTIACNTDTCPTPVDCVVSDWVDGPCSVACGGGILIRTRTIITDSAYGGLPCPVLEDTLLCNTDTCAPVDCMVSDWSDFGPCSVTCGGGIQIRTRTVTTDSAFGGAPCPVLEDTIACNTNPCPVNCEVSDWIDGPCSVTCGGGIQIRTRTIITDSSFGGLPCPVLKDTIACNTGPCPIDCEVSDWSDFGPCSEPCGGGVQIRTRSILTPAQFGGVECPVLADTVSCNTDPCDPCLTLDCDDGNPCTADGCEPFVGCTHDQVLDCIACGSEDCNDHNACTLDECVNDNCINRTIDCDDHDPCTMDGCHSNSGCYHLPKDCNDHNNCTIDECVNGQCVHTPDLD